MPIRNKIAESALKTLEVRRLKGSPSLKVGEAVWGGGVLCSRMTLKFSIWDETCTILLYCWPPSVPTRVVLCVHRRMFPGYGFILGTNIWWIRCVTQRGRDKGRKRSPWPIAGAFFRQFSHDLVWSRQDAKTALSYTQGSHFTSGNLSTNALFHY